MALYLYFSRNLYRHLQRTISTNIFNLKNNDIHSKMLSLEVDSMDDFTTQLIQKKADKWSTRKSLSKISLDVKIEDYSSDNISHFTHLSVTKIDTLFQEAIEVNNNSHVLELLHQCISLKLCPSLSNLLYTLSVCSQCGDIVTIKKIQNLCEDTNPDILEAQSNFQHYVAEGTWIKGNIQEALALFKEVYKDNTFLRRRIRLMLKNLVVDIIGTRSEAVLVSTVNFSEDLAKEYKDYFPLTCIWQICFLSEWYSDQCVAVELLDKYDELCKAVMNRIPYVVAVSLHNHRADVVYRLLETLLKFEMKMQYSGVLLALLDYQIHQKDLRRCVEIVQWSVQNDVELLPVHHHRFLTLFITNEDKTSALNKLKAVKIPKNITHYKF